MPRYPQTLPSRRNALERADYLRDLLGQAERLAQQGREPFLAYLIAMAAEEAARISRGR